MFILNQIVGVGDFSIMDNLRLIVIAAIFIGIIVVLLYLKFTKSGKKTKNKYMQSTNPYDSGSKEKRHSAGVVDDFLSIEEEIKAKKGDDFEDTTESEAEIEEKPVISLEEIEANIKNAEAEIITKFAAAIKEVRAKIDTKFTAEAENIRAEFTTKIEQLISKIEEREKEVVNKIENVIDAKVQEALNKMNDKIGVALHAQKSSTVSVLEKLVDSLRTDEVSAGSFTTEKVEKTVEEKVSSEEVEKKDFWNMLKETSVKDKGILGELASSLQTDEASDSVSPSGESKVAIEETVVSEAITEDGLEAPSEDKTDIKLEENVSEGTKGTIGDAADFDMQAFLDEEPVGISSSGKSNVAVEEDVVPEAITEGELEVPSEGKAGVKLEAEEPIASPGENEKKVSEGAVGDAADFDMQEFLDAEPVGVSSSDESDVVVEKDVLPEAITEDELEVPSEDKADVDLETKDQVASSGKIEEKVPEKAGGDTADFDIQEFLGELENLPSGNNSETEK